MFSKQDRSSGRVCWRLPHAFDGPALTESLQHYLAVGTCPLCAPEVDHRVGVHPGIGPDGDGALATGADASVCGDCIHRPQPDGKRTCYVQMRGVAAVAAAVARGNYRDVSGDLRAVAALGLLRHMRPVIFIAR